MTSSLLTAYSSSETRPLLGKLEVGFTIEEASRFQTPCDRGAFSATAADSNTVRLPPTRAIR